MEDGMVSRRDFVRKGVIAGLAATSAAAAKAASETEEASAQEESTNAPVTPANDMPYGTICGLKISRLILGSNTPGAHSRDLIYVVAMGNAYNTPERMLDTYALAESQGINTIMQGNANLIRQYNTTRGGHLRIIRPVDVDERDNRQRYPFTGRSQTVNGHYQTTH